MAVVAASGAAELCTAALGDPIGERVVGKPRSKHTSRQSQMCETLAGMARLFENNCYTTHRVRDACNNLDCGQPPENYGLWTTNAVAAPIGLSSGRTGSTAVRSSGSAHHSSAAATIERNVAILMMVGGLA